MTDRLDDGNPAARERHAKMRDLVMTWDEITDDLIWGVYDMNGPEHQPIAAGRLEEFCKRFPHFEDRLRWFVQSWNQEDQLTPEALAEIEVKPEQVERGVRFSQWCMRFYDKLHRVKGERDELLAALLATTDALQNMGDFWAYGMAKTEGAKPTAEDDATVTTISTASRKAVDESRALLAKHTPKVPGQ